ncbi:sugar transferase [Schaedlerella arabinosiphila]|uniref:sugar transferase n=1 Tax=Schaedlerella arabinosiphila TaxID=2044587 RepID=UPI0003AB20E5|nr:sugar transferase [Schaedlerella arabinosiphila]
MMKIIGFLVVLFGVCFVLGFIVSRLEKKKGWVEGHSPYGIYEKHIKRPFDFALALFGLVLFWPILLIIAIAVRINMGSPVVFTQERPGLGGEIFKIKKFRTMTDARDAEGNLLPDENRLTKIGKLLRISSGDEASELVNILKGDMAIVGPRPLVPEYLGYYTQEESHRQDVRPGLTGLAQVNGRSFISWEEIFAYDIKYVNSITFSGDLKILLSTVKKVFEKKDIADVSEAWKDDDGRYHCKMGGKEVILHNPLNVERERTNAQRNRQ